jgi:hypothetical protein
MRRGGGEARNLLVINDLQRIAFFLYLFSCAFAERWYIILMQNKEEIMTQNEELLQAALKLVESIKPYSLSEEERALIEVIEQHQLKPKPKRLEGWINLYNDSKPGGTIWPTEQEAKQNCSSNVVRQVHIREVVPVEWKPWTVETLLDFPHYQAIIDAHNAEMERVTK